MARIGSFDESLRPEGWFDETGVVEGWFDDDLIGAAAAAGTTIAGNLGTAAASGFTGVVSANRTIAGALGTATASGFTGTVSNSTDTTIAGALGVAVASGFQGTVTNSSGTTIAGNLGVAVASGFTGGVSGSSEPAETTRRHAGGYKLRKGYLIKGRRYFLSEDELAVHIANMLQEISRGEVKEITAGKPKVISKRVWDTIKPMERLDALSSMFATETIADDDEEETLLMLM